MEIRFAEKKDLETVLLYDSHITREQLEICIEQRQVFIAEENSTFAGWLRYNLFWSNTPFMNLLFVLEGYRNRGYGTALVNFFEEKIKTDGFECVMTSTSSEENARYFYKKLGYKNVGGFNYLDDPYEIIYLKRLK